MPFLPGFIRWLRRRPENALMTGASVLLCAVVGLGAAAVLAQPHASYDSGTDDTTVIVPSGDGEGALPTTGPVSLQPVGNTNPAPSPPTARSRAEATTGANPASTAESGERGEPTAIPSTPATGSEPPPARTNPAPAPPNPGDDLPAQAGSGGRQGPIGVKPPPDSSNKPLPNRLQIPSIGVNAPIENQGVTARGEMVAPKGPSQVAWYTFSARPGSKGNAVFSGHVDYHGVGPAVFWDLRKVKAGDEIAVIGVDGQPYKYIVKLNFTVPLNKFPMAETVGPTSEAAVTLITCEGQFNSTTRLYDQRRVVRAVAAG